MLDAWMGDGDWARTDEVLAAADLADRAGAKQFKLGYLHDHVPIEEAQWYAYAEYTGHSIGVENRRSPQDAATELAERILQDGLCRCGRPVTLYEQVEGKCRWQRVGKRWESSCDAASVRVRDGLRGNLAAMHEAMGARARWIRRRGKGKRA